MQILRINLSALTGQYKAEHDPPGMWSGFDARLPLQEPMRYYPRAGIIRGMELSVDYDHETGERRPAQPLAETKALARRLAWERYLWAHGRTSGDFMTARDLIAVDLQTE